MTEAELMLLLPLTRVRVTAKDYSYEGTVVAVFSKISNSLRCVIEDGDGRLFIHNASQIGRIVGEQA